MGLGIAQMGTQFCHQASCTQDPGQEHVEALVTPGPLRPTAQLPMMLPFDQRTTVYPRLKKYAGQAQSLPASQSD